MLVEQLNVERDHSGNGIDRERRSSDIFSVRYPISSSLIARSFKPHYGVEQSTTACRLRPFHSNII